MIATLRSRPWATAAVLYAWCTAVILTALIEPETLALAVPPALVATFPLVMPWRHHGPAVVIAAVLLGLWAIIGIALLGPYFLPSAILLGVGYVRLRASVRPRANRSTQGMA
ncbi:hypothetical protein [Saccharomonospora saliphila]|uniref:hypothetical protein n=1 Tax=Saccharomonospora saliphila TaxID=369829 RepID=UPI0012F7B855|nr:hypothetical protein [Saccharomonospora saliphila]